MNNYVIGHNLDLEGDEIEHLRQKEKMNRGRV